jgi:hypothetical protein
MIDAGVAAFETFSGDLPNFLLVDEIYRAMDSLRGAP